MTDTVSPSSHLDDEQNMSADEQNMSASPLTYATYLHLDELLAQLHPLTKSNDEQLFITIHQSFELWFREILFELAFVRDAMFDGDANGAQEHLRRATAIDAMLVQQLALLDTMSPMSFHEFRSALGSASGMQSRQFGEIEALSGLVRHATTPTVWDGYLKLLSRNGFATDSEETIVRSLVVVARDRTNHWNLWSLGEALLDHDQAWVLWRSRHVMIVQRILGELPGTGGTAGQSYLQMQVGRHFYPLLWQARTLLAVGPPAGASYGQAAVDDAS